jgi:hypothetical protein
VIRTQIQLPDPLYREVQRIAKAQDWSIAEVMRRGAEAVVRAYPQTKEATHGNWQLPPPLAARLLIQDPTALRVVLLDDLEDRAP